MLFECIEGICKRINGYIKYSNIIILKCDLTICEKLDGDIICNKNNIGVAYYNSNLDFTICINTGDRFSNKYTDKKINNDGSVNYIFNLVENSSLKYNLYKSDKNGYLIGLSVNGNKS